jgi:hypothetical protein
MCLKHPIDRYKKPALTDEEIETILSDKIVGPSDDKICIIEPLTNIIYNNFDLKKLEKLLTLEYVNGLNDNTTILEKAILGRHITMIYNSVEFQDIEVITVMKIFATKNVKIEPWTSSNFEVVKLSNSDNVEDRFKWVFNCVIKNFVELEGKNFRPNLIKFYKEMLSETLTKDNDSLSTREAIKIINRDEVYNTTLDISSYLINYE